MYDTVWLYALAIDKVLRAGGDPHDGDTLSAALRTTTVDGLSGHIAFDATTGEFVGTYARGGLHGPSGMSSDDGGALWVACYESSQIVLFNSTTTSSGSVARRRFVNF